VPVALPLISVLRPVKSLFGHHGWRKGNTSFDKSLSVHAVPRLDDAAVALLSPLVTLVAGRDDWTFAFGGPRLVCVTRDRFGSTEEPGRSTPAAARKCRLRRLGRSLGSVGPSSAACLVRR
jgi:hypothetical protein